MLDSRKLRKLSRFNITAFALLFLLLWLSVFWGKAKISFGWQIPFLLSDVAEFLLLLAIAVFFTFTALCHEALASKKRESTDD
jgi:hypothetical protein